MLVVVKILNILLSYIKLNIRYLKYKSKSSNDIFPVKVFLLILTVFPPESIHRINTLCHNIMFRQVCRLVLQWYREYPSVPAINEMMWQLIPLLLIDQLISGHHCYDHYPGLGTSDKLRSDLVLSSSALITPDNSKLKQISRPEISQFYLFVSCL